METKSCIRKTGYFLTERSTQMACFFSTILMHYEYYKQKL